MAGCGRPDGDFAGVNALRNLGQVSNRAHDVGRLKRGLAIGIHHGHGLLMSDARDESTFEYIASVHHGARCAAFARAPVHAGTCGDIYHPYLRDVTNNK